MEPIEGITPSALWTFLYVLVALAGVAVLMDKVADIWRKRQERKEKPSQSIHDRLAGIDVKLDNDKRRIEALERRQENHDEGFRALCQATLALLNKQLHNGNDDEMQQASKELQDYLIRRT